MTSDRAPRRPPRRPHRGLPALRRGTALVALAAVLSVSATAGAAAADDNGGPSAAATISSGGAAITQFGRVVYVTDGDTVDVAIDGTSEDPDRDGRPGTRIRLLGIQAMELHTYHHDLTKVTGECHGPEAARRLGQLLYNEDGSGKRVRLTARDATSSNLGRSARFLATQSEDGAWHDVGAVLMREGQVLASYQRVEYTENRTYRSLSEAAAAAGIGLWDQDFCGKGPTASLAVRVNWDAAGNDSTNVNGEYVRITNRGSRTVPLAGWWVRDSATRAVGSETARRRGYIFPAHAVVRPGRSVFLHVGKKPAHARAGHFYYGLSSPIFENETAKPTYLGDGAYLFDPQGDLRAWQQYACVSRRAHACTS